MKILEVRDLVIPDVKAIRFGRFCDNRGYFTEPYRKSDFFSHPDLQKCMRNIEFVQVNESFSGAGVMRGLHFQWNPFMGKLVRTVTGRMIDMFLDIRKGSPTFGKIAALDMPHSATSDHCEWIWVPPGFAHGNFFPVDTTIEYFCSGEYSQGCEAGISPLAPDLDWSLCEPGLKRLFESLVASGVTATDKDKNGLTLEQWKNDRRSDVFVFGRCESA